ncbi:MAG: potassium channel family protein [Betaproteobacteria bacterium]
MQLHDNEVDEDLTQLVRVGGRCSYVLLALLSLILLYPYVIEWAWGRLVLMAMVSCIVIAIAYAVGRSRERLIATSFFAVTLLGLQWTYLATGDRLIFGVGVIIFLLFMVFAIAQLFAYLMRHGPVTGDKLHAALAVYVLGAFLWAGLYTLLNHINPASFMVNTARGGLLDFYDMLYFSFTTLSSAGYGDLTPATRRAESLVILEQIAGVFYVAVLIARLAGLYPPGADRPK